MGKNKKTKEAKVIIENEIAPVVSEKENLETSESKIEVNFEGNYKTLKIKNLFNIIAKKENIKFVPYELYRQKTPIFIKGPDGSDTKVVGLMTKIEPLVKLEFTDGTTLVAARRHIINIDKKNVYMEELRIGDKLDGVVTAKEIKTITTTQDKRIVFDLQVDRKDHLFSDTSGIIHHNTFDITLTLQNEGLSEGKGYKMLKGGGSTVELYNILFKNSKVLPSGQQPLLVFDDYDTVLTDDLSVNFLKGALDSGGVRQLSYPTKAAEYFNPEDYFLVKDYTSPISGKTFKGNFPDNTNEIFMALTEGCSVLELVQAFYEEGWGHLGRTVAGDEYADKKTQAKMTKSIVEIVGSKLSNKEKKLVAVYLGGEAEEELKAEIEDLLEVLRIDGKIPSTFVFEGLAIFITNLTLDSKLLAPLKSRSAKMEINLNAGELVERIGLIHRKNGFKPFCKEFNISEDKILVALEVFKKKAAKDPENMSGVLSVRAFTKVLGVIGSDKLIKGDVIKFSERYYS